MNYYYMNHYTQIDKINFTIGWLLICIFKGILCLIMDYYFSNITPVLKSCLLTCKDRT